MKFSIRRALLGLAVLSFGLAGCNGAMYPEYSANVKYTVRIDPVLMGEAKDLGDDRYDPERPGIFPLMKMSDMDQAEHPYHPRRSKIDDKVLRNPMLISTADRKELEEALETLFGTPAKPIVNAKEIGLDAKVVEELKIDDDTLAKGSVRYRVHCLHCHGVPGDGRGPTGRWVNPHPRDFRAMLFKFQSTDQSVKGEGKVLPPSRADLERTLRNGLEGTAMPSFNLLLDEDIEYLISYVLHLTLRGKAEHDAIKFGFDFKDNALAKGGKGDLKTRLAKTAKEAAAKFRAANKKDARIEAKPYPYDETAPDYYDVVLKNSVLRGQQIFNAKPSPELTKELIGKMSKSLGAKMKSDAEEDALGKKIDAALDKKKEDAKKKDPKLTEADLAKIELTDKEKASIKLDVKELAELQKTVDESLAGKAKGILTGVSCVTCHNNYGRQALYRFDAWGTLARPMNLTQGVLRGGKRPIDIYYRIHSGINGSGMTGFGNVFEGNEQYMWDVVNFVSVLPYPAMREKLKIKLD